MAEMYMGQPIFPGANTTEQLQLIADILGPIPPNYPNNDNNNNNNNDKLKYKNTAPSTWKQILSEMNTASNEAADFISKILIYDPESRLDFLETLLHPFLSPRIQC